MKVSIDIAGRPWTWQRWVREYVRAYVDLLHIAERWIPPFHWHCELYRVCAVLRWDVVGEEP